jgi:hypothetical protein
MRVPVKYMSSYVGRMFSEGTSLKSFNFSILIIFTLTSVFIVSSQLISPPVLLVLFFVRKSVLVITSDHVRGLVVLVVVLFSSISLFLLLPLTIDM